MEERVVVDEFHIIDCTDSGHDPGVADLCKRRRATRNGASGLVGDAVLHIGQTSDSPLADDRG